MLFIWLCQLNKKLVLLAQLKHCVIRTRFLIPRYHLDCLIKITRPLFTDSVSLALARNDISYPMITEEAEFALLHKPPFTTNRKYLAPTLRYAEELSIGFIIVKIYLYNIT